MAICFRRIAPISLLTLSFLDRANEANEPSLDGMARMKSEKQLYGTEMDP